MSWIDKKDKYKGRIKRTSNICFCLHKSDRRPSISITLFKALQHNTVASCRRTCRMQLLTNIKPHICNTKTTAAALYSSTVALVQCSDCAHLTHAGR